MGNIIIKEKFFTMKKNHYVYSDKKWGFNFLHKNQSLQLCNKK